MALIVTLFHNKPVFFITKNLFLVKGSSNGSCSMVKTGMNEIRVVEFHLLFSITPTLWLTLLLVLEKVVLTKNHVKQVKWNLLIKSLKNPR